MKDFLELNGNECTAYPNLWDTMKMVRRAKFIVLENLEHSWHNSTPESPKTKTQKEQMPRNDQTMIEINKREKYKESLKQRFVLFCFEKIYKTDKLLSNLIKKLRERIQVNKIRDENGA